MIGRVRGERGLESRPRRLRQ